MHVAYLVNCYGKVSHTFIRREATALTALGFTVMRVSIRPPDVGLVDEADLNDAKQTRVILARGLGSVWMLMASVALVALRSPTRFARTLLRALRLSRRADRGLIHHLAYLAEACVLLRWTKAADVAHVHAHFGTNSTTVALLCDSLGGPGFSFACHGPEEFDKPQLIMLPEKIDRARFVTAVSSYARSQLYRYCDPTHWPKIHIVRCGLDAPFLNAPLVPVPETRRLVCVGRLSEQKGHRVLIEAFARAVQHEPNAELVLVGDGELRETIEAQVVAAGLSKQVRITGWATNAQVREELSQSRALVMASFAEGLPVVIMEALAMGRPVIATHIAGIPELITDACGVLVPAGARDAMVNAMLTMLRADTDQLNALGTAGRIRVAALHDVACEATYLESLFRHYGVNHEHGTTPSWDDASLISERPSAPVSEEQLSLTV
jgi:colanic acid/amylovoran biosynthesis glycosyltransferase